MPWADGTCADTARSQQRPRGWAWGQSPSPCRGRSPAHHTIPRVCFSSPEGTAEFSKFAGILSAALSQHHLSGFEIAQLEFYHLH